MSKSMLFSTPPKWQEGAKWEAFFKIYDRIAEEQFGNTTESSRLVRTSFGDTQVFVCGNPENPPLAFFHGINACSLMFGEWLMPKLSENYYTIAIDTIGDLGRSVPRDGDPANGPKTQQEVADWAIQVFDAVLPSTETTTSENAQQQQRVVNLIGYSFGSFLATCVAQHRPDRVGKVILMAPAGVFAPIRSAWIARAIGVGLLSALIPSMSNTFRMGFMEYMLADPTTNKKNIKRLDLLQAAGAIGSSKVNVMPAQSEVPVLQKMNKSNPTMLIIGEQESVIDPKVAVETAKKSNMTVKTFDNAGHLLYCEVKKELVTNELEAFLKSK